MKRYWHRLSKRKIAKLRKSSMTFGELKKKYKQPKWCDYPDALAGLMGCWSLWFYPKKINRKFCASCDLCKHSPNFMGKWWNERVALKEANNV